MMLISRSGKPALLHEKKKAEGEAKRIKKMIGLFLILCLLAAGFTAGAESPHFEGKPWVNSNFYGIWPAERPACLMPLLEITVREQQSPCRSAI